jgi:hypothetical protein
MKRRKTSDEARKAFQAMYNALVPPIEEIDDSEVVDFLLSSGIDPDSLTTKAYEHLQKIAGDRYLSRGESVPAELKNALQQLKPTSMTEKIAKESEKARSTIRALFESALKIIGPIDVGRGPCLDPAFRNKTELTESDKEKLARLQEELDSGGDRSRRRNQGEYL